jgi:hypothetical protein
MADVEVVAFKLKLRGGSCMSLVDLLDRKFKELVPDKYRSSACFRVLPHDEIEVFYLRQATADAVNASLLRIAKALQAFDAPFWSEMGQEIAEAAREIEKALGAVAESEAEEVKVIE